MSVADGPLFVIDDDPTGAQGQAGVPILLAFSRRLIEAAVAGAPGAVHLLTNSRAMDEAGAYAVVRDAAESVSEVVTSPGIILRGDSTLRAHLLPEYEALRDVLWPTVAPPLLLVPALPGAGRVTLDGRHLLAREGKRVPLEQTEFAADGPFSYSTSLLVDWAAERSGGFFRAEGGIEIGLERIRSAQGSAAVRDALLAAAGKSAPVVVVPDAETAADLYVIASGLNEARALAPAIAVRCAPTFASVLSGCEATDVVPTPSVERGLLVAVGSHVPMTTAQLTALNARYPGSLVELDASVLAGPGAAATVVDASARARALLGQERLAIVATSRVVEDDALGPDAGLRVARGLARIVSRLEGAYDVLLSKGGITSAVNVREGLGADRADIVGPVTAGISLWNVHAGNGLEQPVIVFPGNVGGTHELADLVHRLIGE